MNNNQCNEVISDEIVRVEIYLASQVNFTLPTTVPFQSINLTANLFGTAAFVAALSDADAVALDDSPTLKIKNARQEAGNVYVHDLQVPVLVERAAAESLVNTLKGEDFHVVYTRADGSRDMSMTLPNAASCDIEESHSSSAKTTLKIKIRSMSNLIKLVA